MQIYDRLDDVYMSTIDREHAKAHMRSAEATIDFIAAAVARTRTVGVATGRRVINLARRSQFIIVKLSQSHDPPCKHILRRSTAVRVQALDRR